MKRQGAAFVMAIVAALTAVGLEASKALVGAPLQLSPLTQADGEGIGGLGCDFSIGKDNFLLLDVDGAVIKLNGTARRFKLDEDHAMSIINFGGTFGTFETRILVDRDDQPIAIGEEGRSSKARLTVRRDGQERTINGIWTCGA